MSILKNLYCLYVYRSEVKNNIQFFCFYFFIYLNLCVCHSMHMDVRRQLGRNQSSLSIHVFQGTQVVRLGRKQPYLLSHLTCPTVSFKQPLFKWTTDLANKKIKIIHTKPHSWKNNLNILQPTAKGKHLCMTEYCLALNTEKPATMMLRNRGMWKTSSQNGGELSKGFHV